MLKNLNMEDKTMDTITRLQEIFNVLDCYETMEAKLYWIDVMVMMGDITEGQAGYIIHSLGMLE